MAFARGLVVLLTFFTISEAFFSSATLDVDSESAVQTRDHDLITKLGLFRCLVEFVKDNPRYVHEEMVKDFEDLQRITVTADEPKTIQRLITVMVSKMRLQNALTEIQSSNAEVNSAPLKMVASAHFSGEQFKDGAKRLYELNSEIITTLLKSVKYEHARQLVGQYLHTLQDFYSHSNWVELGHSVRKFSFSSNQADLFSPQFLAKPNEATCVPCQSTAGQEDDCDNNLITNKITSGYYGGQDITKPTNVSKCSHGGILDSSRGRGTRGGINKESASRKLSPHYKFHALAAEHAVEATKQFFENLRAAVGDKTFACFLNLQAVRTLALVIDDTGSMGEEIKSVKKLSINFVQKTKNPTANMAFMYILVPFNDPRVGPVTATSDANEVIEAVNSLEANKGGDCPEQGMTGLYKALLQSVQDSVIHYFSDADVKDFELAQVVLILAKQKRVKINFILSGRCRFSRRRRSTREEPRLGSQDLFRSLAAATGGQVLKTKKNKVSVLVDIIGSKSYASDNRDLTEVILLHVSSDSKQDEEDTSFMIDVDNTLKDVLIVLSAEGDLGITLLNPTDDQPLRAAIHSQFDHIHVAEVKKFHGGQLMIRVRCTGPYSLQVTGRSVLDFTYQLSSVENLESGERKQLFGSPVKGQKLLLTLAFTKPELIKEVNSLSLINSSGVEMESFTVKKGKEIHRDSLHVLFAPSFERFRFQLNGKTTEGFTLRRIKPTEIKTEEVQLDFNDRTLNSSRRIIPNVTSKIQLKITNMGNSENFTLKAMDDLGFIQSVEPHNCFVAAKDTAEFLLIVKAPANATKGETSTVTVYASPTSSESPSNYMVFYVSVKEIESIFPPKCEVTNQIEKCDPVYHLSNCSTITWKSYINIYSPGQQLLAVTSKNLELGQLNVSPYETGMFNSSVSGVYTSTCCHPTASIIVVDQNGNTAVCELSAVTPIINIKPNIKFSELNVLVGKKSKLEFNITNLGTKSSFSLQVSDSEYCIGFVTPININMDHKEVVRCEVVLIGSKKTGSNKTSLLVDAVPLAAAIDATEIRLLEVDVIVEAEADGPSLGWNVTADLDHIPYLIIHYGDEEELLFQVKNHGQTGTFNFIASRSNNVYLRFVPNPVNLDNSETTVLKLVMNTKQNHPSEEEIVVSALPNWSSKMIKLFSKKVQVIPALKSVVSSGKVLMSTGAIVSETFTVINFGRRQHFTFKVSCPGTLTCHITPDEVVLKQNESIVANLTVESSKTMELDTMEVKVMALSSSSKNSTAGYLIFTLETTIKDHIIAKETKEKDKMGFITILVIILICVLIFALCLLAMCCYRRKRGSWNVWKTKSNQQKQRVKVELSTTDDNAEKTEMV